VVVMAVAGSAVSGWIARGKMSASMARVFANHSVLALSAEMAAVWISRKPAEGAQRPRRFVAQAFASLTAPQIATAKTAAVMDVAGPAATTMATA